VVAPRPLLPGAVAAAEADAQLPPLHQVAVVRGHKQLPPPPYAAGAEGINKGSASHTLMITSVGLSSNVLLCDTSKVRWFVPVDSGIITDGPWLENITTETRKVMA